MSPIPWEIPIAAAGLSSLVVQCLLQSWWPMLCALLSPVPSLCCVGILLMLHPIVGTVLVRSREYAQSYGRQMAAEVLATDPVIQAAMHAPRPPQPWTLTIYALILHALADLATGIGDAQRSGGNGVSTVCNSLRDAASAAAAGCMLYAIWTLPNALPRVTQGAFLAIGVACGLQLHAAPRELTGGTQSAGPRAATSTDAAAPTDWGMLISEGLGIAHLMVGCGLVAQSVLALMSAVSARRSAWRRQQPPQASDVSRWCTQLAGSVLLLSRPLLAAYLPAGGGALGTTLQRVGCVMLTLSGYLDLHPHVRSEEEGFEAVDAAGGPQSIAQMKEARRAAREAAARRRAERPPPLLQDSREGGVQGLRCHDLSLCRDPDGDEAHDFWEALPDGAFRRCSFSQ